MAHLESYDSFQTKKAREQKRRAKERSSSKEKMWIEAKSL